MPIRAIAGGKIKKTEDSLCIENNESIDSSKNKLKAILIEDGWDIIKEENKTIEFEKSSSFASNLALSKLRFSSIKIIFSNNVIEIQILQIGNYKYGTEKNINNTFNQIKELYITK